MRESRCAHWDLSALSAPPAVHQEWQTMGGRSVHPHVMRVPLLVCDDVASCARTNIALL